MRRSWPFNLRTPTQVESQDPSVLLDPRALRSWLDQLPLMRLNITLESLKTALSGLNQQKIPYKNRLKLLDEYRSTLLKIYPTSEPDTLKRLPVKPEDRTRTREEMGRFCQLLADGYKIVLKESYEAGDEATSPALLHSLFHSMEILILELVNDFRCYHAVRPLLYAEIYLLYKIAHQGDVLQASVTLQEHASQPRTIDDVFIQAMLLAAADPFRLPQATALDLFYLLAPYTRFARLFAHETGPLASHHFVINLGGDLPPSPVIRAGKELLESSKLVLDKDALERKIAADITQFQGDGNTPLKNDDSEKIRLLKILAPVAAENRVRRSERKQVVRHVKTVFGINNVHRFFALGPEQLKILLDTDADEFDGVSLSTWTIQNESLTGYMLATDQSPTQEIRVGDILAIHNPQEDSVKHPGKIAVIRWMQQESESQTQIGVELIPGKVMPAVCRIEEADIEHEPAYKGIFISSVTALNQPATLLFPKKPYRRGRILHVSIGEQPLRIRANFLREDSFCFDRFDFSSMET